LKIYYNFLGKQHVANITPTTKENEKKGLGSEGVLQAINMPKRMIVKLKGWIIFLLNYQEVRQQLVEGNSTN